MKFIEVALLELYGFAEIFEFCLMFVDALGVLLAQVFFLLDLGEIGVEAFLVALAMEGVHPAPALPLLLPNLVVFHLKSLTMVRCSISASSPRTPLTFLLAEKDRATVAPCLSCCAS